MSTTLTNGLKLPDKGSVDWYADMQSNYQILDGAVGTVAEHTTQIAGKASASHTHGNITNDGKVGTASKVLISDSNKKITTSSVSDTELGYLSGVTSAIQTQISGKANASHTHSASDITSGLATVATSGSYNDLSNKPTIPTVNNATLTIQKNGTTVKTFTANASSNVTANITVPTKTSELTNDSGYLTSHQSLANYVTLDGSQTISGAKTFSKRVTVSVESSTDSGYSVNANVSRKDVGDGKYYGTYINAGVASGPGVLGVYGYIRNTDGTSELQMRLITSKSDGNYILKALQFQTDRYGNTWQFIPSINNTINLGTSSNKWKSLNGINPGALSFPGTGGFTNIKGDITNLSGGANTFTAPYDGWVCVKSTNATVIHIINTVWAVSQSATQSTAGTLCCLCPVMSGESFRVIVNATSLDYAYIHPCKGNV